MRVGDDEQGTLWDWLYSHRLGLGPVYYAVVVLFCGLAARFALDEWATIQVVLAAAACALAPAVWAATRLHSKWRRCYTYVCLTSGVAWVGLVHSETMTTQQLAVALLVGTLVLGIGWWADKTKRDKVRVEGELAEWEEISQRIGLSGTRWVGHVEQPGRGWTAQLVWPAGMFDRDDVMKKAAKIEGARDLPAGSLRLMPHGRDRNRLDAFAVMDDPHTEAVEWPGPAKMEGYSAADPVPLGRHEDETPAEVQRYRPGRGERRLLIGGSADSGKSGAINHFVGEDACRDDVCAMNMDFKGGMELSAWAGVAAWTVTGIDGGIEMCVALEAAITTREEINVRNKWRVWQASSDYPVIHVNIDELRELAGSGLGRTAKQSRDIIDRLEKLATQGRAVGIGVLMAGQRLTTATVGSTLIRSQADIRLCFRMNDTDGEGYVLDLDKGASAGASQIPGDRPGTFYLKVDQTLDRLPIRMYHWPDELVEQVAQLRAGANAWIDPETEEAMMAVAPMFADIVRGRRGEDTAPDEAADAADVSEDVPAWTDGPDVSLDAVTSIHDKARGVTRLRPLGGGRKEPRLSDVAAREAMWTALRRVGDEGATAKELYRAAGRSSSWFHPIMSGWIEAGKATRTSRGSYAAVRAESQNGHPR